jgi:hypothetical protein
LCQDKRLVTATSIRWNRTTPWAILATTPSGAAMNAATSGALRFEEVARIAAQRLAHLVVGQPAVVDDLRPLLRACEEARRTRRLGSARYSGESRGRAANSGDSSSQA